MGYLRAAQRRRLADGELCGHRQGSQQVIQVGGGGPRGHAPLEHGRSTGCIHHSADPMQTTGKLEQEDADRLSGIRTQTTHSGTPGG